ncbi:hypothetical protein EMIT0196MI5_190055 [Pseudomonas sp. IT-196MI5]
MNYTFQLLHPIGKRRMASLAAASRPKGLPVVASLSEIIMKRFSPVSLCIALSILSSPGWAQSVVPMKGQSSQQTQADMSECQSIANSQAASTSSTPSGGRVKGAAAGAAAGAVASGVRSNQHDAFDDRVDSDVKQNVRQDRAKETAAAGMVVGGSRQRQERREQSKTTQANTSTAYTSCLQGKGYQVNP